MLYFKALREACPSCPTPTRRSERDSTPKPRPRWPANARRARLRRPQTAARGSSRPTPSASARAGDLPGEREPMSQLLERNKPDSPALPSIELALVPSDRGELHRRIEARLTRCSRRLVKELRGLRKRHPLDPAAVDALRRVPAGLAAPRWQASIVMSCAIAASSRTRQLAKRQLTWLGR